MTVKIKINPDFRKIINYDRFLGVLDFIAQTGKIKIILTGKTPDYYYGYEQCNESSFIFYSELYYDKNIKFELVDNKWMPYGIASKYFDPIGAIYRIFILFDEQQRKNKNNSNGFTSFLTTDLTKERQSFKGLALVDQWVDTFIEKLIGKKNVPQNILKICLTHDVDGPEIYHFYEISKSFFKLIRFRNLKYWWQVVHGIKSKIRKDKGPFWRFIEWLEQEKKLNACSTFFFYPGKNIYKNHFNDPPYHIDNSSKWNILNEIEKNGGEVGIHPGIYYKKEEQAFLNSRLKFNKRGIPALGIRHHYWELNWADPFETFRKQANSGLKYDLSIAWKDSPGFRLATCRPFKTWFGQENTLDHVVIPSTIMDGHLFQYANYPTDECRLQAIERIIKEVFEKDGVLVLDWHERTFEDTLIYPGYGKFYFKLLKYLNTNFDVDYLLPREIFDGVLGNYHNHRLILEN